MSLSLCIILDCMLARFVYDWICVSPRGPSAALLEYVVSRHQGRHKTRSKLAVPPISIPQHCRCANATCRFSQSRRPLFSPIKTITTLTAAFSRENMGLIVSVMRHHLLVCARRYKVRILPLCICISVPLTTVLPSPLRFFCGRRRDGGDWRFVLFLAPHLLFGMGWRCECLICMGALSFSVRMFTAACGVVGLGGEGSE